MLEREFSRRQLIATGIVLFGGGTIIAQEAGKAWIEAEHQADIETNRLMPNAPSFSEVLEAESQLKDGTPKGLKNAINALNHPETSERALKEIETLAPIHAEEIQKNGEIVAEGKKRDALHYDIAKQHGSNVSGTIGMGGFLAGAGGVAILINEVYNYLAGKRVSSHQNSGPKIPSST